MKKSVPTPEALAQPSHAASPGADEHSGSSIRFAAVSYYIVWFPAALLSLILKVTILYRGAAAVGFALGREPIDGPIGLFPTLSTPGFPL